VDDGIGDTFATGGGANKGGAAAEGGGEGPRTDMVAGGRGIGVERGGGGDAGLVAQVKDTDWGLEWFGVAWVRWVNGSGVGAAEELKKDMGDVKSPAEAGGPS